MKTLAHKKFGFVLLSFLLIGQFAFAKNDEASRSKTINKSFTLKDGQAVSISNKFGDVNIVTNDSKELKVKVDVSIEINSDSKAQKLLDGITIEINESNESIEIKTKFTDDSKWKDMKDGKNMEINYEVEMPKNAPLKLKNSFGEVSVGDINAKTDIDVSFGAVKLGKLLNEENKLEFQFSDPIIIDELGGGEVDLKFSKMELDNAGNIVLNSEMSTSSIDRAKKADYRVKMGGLNIDNVDELILKSNMSSVSIDRLNSKGDINVNYGKFDIGMLSKEFTELKIDGDFTPIDIRLEEGLNCYIEAKSKMGSLSLPRGLKVKQDDEDWNVGNNEYFKGEYGGSSNSTINISSSFGGVTIR